MKLNKRDVQSFALAIWNTYDLKNYRVNKSRALDFIESEFVDEVEGLNSKETKKARNEKFKIGKPQDYAEKLISFSDEKKAVCGIRHFGGDPNLPFVSCVPNYKLSSKSEIDFLSKSILSHFEIFKPRYMSFWTSQEMEVDFIGSICCISSFEDISNKSTWPSESSIKLIPVQDESYYAWYEQGYKEFHSMRADLKSKVPINSQEAMRESLDQNLMYYAVIDNQKIGLIAGARDDFLGHPGLYFNEIFLSQNWKGKGLAKAIQRKFILENANDGDIIWGTIDCKNQPSLRTAISNGRKPVRFECFKAFHSKL